MNRLAWPMAAVLLATAATWGGAGPAMAQTKAAVTPEKPAAGELRPAALFSDHMVLQAGRQTNVWGWDKPGRNVTVRVGEAKAAGKAGDDGRWEVKLPPVKAGGPMEMTIEGSGQVVVKDVLAGEVWVGSGQSNMEMPVDWGVWGAFGTPEFTKNAAEANFPSTLRMFKVRKNAALQPERDVRGEWQVCSYPAILKWSALGYFFGLDLQRQLSQTPVGFINCSLGGTSIQLWSSRKCLLETSPDSKKQLEYSWDAAQTQQADFEKKEDAWKEAAAKAKAAGQPIPPEPNVPNFLPRPSSLFCGMLRPVMPYTISGVIWYQGESNRKGPSALAYGKNLIALIKDWRAEWGQGDFPFLLVQLPNYREECKTPVQVLPAEDSGWAMVRDGQFKALQVPKTALVVTIDIGEAASTNYVQNIHPRNKQEAGRRAALAAARLAYGKDIVANGPLYAGSAIKDGKVTISFTSIGGGLKVRGGGELKGFAIAGSDKTFVWAQARIEGDTVVVWSDEVKEPAAVRYAWAENPIGNLENVEGLPATQLRTDDW